MQQQRSSTAKNKEINEITFFKDRAVKTFLTKGFHITEGIQRERESNTEFLYSVLLNDAGSLGPLGPHFNSVPGRNYAQRVPRFYSPPLLPKGESPQYDPTDTEDIFM